MGLRKRGRVVGLAEPPPQVPMASPHMHLDKAINANIITCVDVRKNGRVVECNLTIALPNRTHDVQANANDTERATRKHGAQANDNSTKRER